MTLLFRDSLCVNVIVRTSIAHSMDSINHVIPAKLVVCSAARSYIVCANAWQDECCRSMSDVVETMVDWRLVCGRWCWYCGCSYGTPSSRNCCNSKQKLSQANLVVVDLPPRPTVCYGCLPCSNAFLASMAWLFFCAPVDPLLFALVSNSNLFSFAIYLHLQSSKGIAIKRACKDAKN